MTSSTNVIWMVDYGDGRLQHAGRSQQPSLGARRDSTCLKLEVIVSREKTVDRCSARLDN